MRTKISRRFWAGGGYGGTGAERDQSYRYSTTRSAGRQVGDRLAERLYPIPNPYASDVQYARFHHSDLPGLDDQQLAAESRRVQFALDWGERPDPWLVERLAAIRAESVERRRGAESAKPQQIEHRPAAQAQQSAKRPLTDLERRQAAARARLERRR